MSNNRYCWLRNDFGTKLNKLCFDYHFSRQFLHCSKYAYEQTIEVLVFEASKSVKNFDYK